MKPILYLIVICVVGYFGWSYLNPSQPSGQLIEEPTQQRITEQAISNPPTPLPTGRAVNDQFDSLTVGGNIFYDVTVRSVFPDSISIFHRNGVATLAFSDVPKEIQDKYCYDPDQAKAYAELKAAHVECKKAQEKTIETEQNVVVFGHDAPTTDAAPDMKPSSQADSVPIPKTLRNVIAYGNEQNARTEFEKYLRTATKLEARGTVVRLLDSGHLLARGSIGNPKTRGMSYNQTYLLFGLPEAGSLADGDTFNAFVVMGDPVKTPSGSRVREYIYVDEEGRRPVRFPMNSEMYD